MRKPRRMAVYWAAVTLAVATMAVLSLVDFPLRNNVQNLLFDEYQRWRPRVEAEETPVRVVDIDEESIQRLGRWPWPRARIADLLRRIESARPASIALDLLFSEEERADSHEGDEALAAAISDGPVVLGTILTNAVRAADLPKVAGFAFAGDDPLPFLPHFRGMIPPLASIAKGASGVGFMNWLPDNDRVLRRVPLVTAINDQLHPSLAMEALRVAQGASTFLIKSSNASGEYGFGAKTGIVSIKNGDFVVPTDHRGALRLYYADHEKPRTIPAWKVLQDGFDASELAEKIVFIGVSASLLSDTVATPLRPDEPGVQAQAQVLAQALTGSNLVRPDWAPGAEWIISLIVSLALALALPQVSVAVCGAFGIAAVSAFTVASIWAFGHGLLLDPIMPTVSTSAVYLTGVIALYGLKSRDELEMRSAFGRYVSPAVVAKLAQHPGQLTLSGEERVLTVMFCDLRSFTTLSEGLSANELRQFLNDYLTPMTDAVLEASGTVDKYMGDAIMAFWNAPLDDENHARNAVEASLKMRALLVGLNQRWSAAAEGKARPYKEVKFGIGLNTGECCVGNLGSTRRFDYSAIGDEVNVASRLEGSSKAFGVDIVASASTVALTEGYAWLEVDEVLLNNKTRPVGVFTLAGDEQYARTSAFASLRRAHDEMLAGYRSRAFQEAQDAAAIALSLAPEPIRGLYSWYGARLSKLEQADLPAEWRPVLALEEK